MDDRADILDIETFLVPQAGLALSFVGDPFDHDTWLSTGRAVCHPDDIFDPDIGELMAVGRALESLGRKYIRRANGLVKHAEDCEAHRAQLAKQREGNLWPVAKEAFYRSVQAKRQ